jgi:hypothetical protein
MPPDISKLIMHDIDGMSMEHVFLLLSTKKLEEEKNEYVLATNVLHFLMGTGEISRWPNCKWTRCRSISLFDIYVVNHATLTKDNYMMMLRTVKSATYSLYLATAFEHAPEAIMPMQYVHLVRIQWLTADN